MRASLQADDEYAIASLASLLQRVDERVHATGKSPDEVAAGVVEDLERAALSMTARTTPLVPSCGVLVAVAGLGLKVESVSVGVAEIFLGLAVLSAVGALWLLGSAHFVYVGCRTIGLDPTVADIGFARSRLIRKQVGIRRGSWLAAIALTCLMVGILCGVDV